MSSELYTVGKYEHQSVYIVNFEGYFTGTWNAVKSWVLQKAKEGKYYDAIARGDVDSVNAANLQPVYDENDMYEALGIPEEYL